MGVLVDARQVFDKLLKKDVVSWNLMIGAYAQHGHVKEAYTLFCQMQRVGLKPEVITYMSILNACACPTGFETWQGGPCPHYCRWDFNLMCV